MLLAVAGQVERLPIEFDLLEGNAPHGLRAAQLRVGLRDLGLERDECVVAVFDRRLGLRASRFGRAAHAAEQVQLP